MYNLNDMNLDMDAMIENDIAGNEPFAADLMDSFSTHQGDAMNDLMNLDDEMATHQGDAMNDLMNLDDEMSTHQGDAMDDPMNTDDGLSAHQRRAGDPSQLSFDTDGDNVADTSIMDSDGNGTYEIMANVQPDGTYTKMYDYNQDGTPDSGECYIDANQDGIFDMVVDILDTDHDGSADTARVYADLDGDMQADYEYTTAIDFPEIMSPSLGDAVIETDSVVSLGEKDELVLVNQGDDLDLDVIAPQGLSQFSPEAADMDKVIGDPAESMEYWEYQGPTNRCAIYSQKFVIEELTGQDLNVDDLAQLAEDQNWFSEDGGTSLLHTNKLLDYYGIDNTMSFDNTMADIENCLSNGGKVIVGVNADEIWYGEESNIFVPTSGANHALQVVGVDYSDPANPQVILNDSGAPDGCGEMVPLDVFVGAWEDGNCQMIACYA